MTKARLHPSLLEFKGAMGDMVFKKRGKKIYVSIKPEGTSDPSEKQLAQKAQRERFKLASAYAKAALADPDVRAIYEERAAEVGQSAFALARTDYFDGKDFLSKK